MYSNGKHVVPAAILVLILCVLSTNQTLRMFSRKKTTVPPQLTDDYFAQQTGTVPQKEHWWQVKRPPVESNEAPPTQNQPNQVAVAIPLINQKLQSIIDSHSDVKWVPCLCPIKKPAHKPPQHLKPKPQHHHQQQQQQQHQQQQPQQQHQQQHQQHQQQPLEQSQEEEQQEEQQQQLVSSYTSTTTESSSYENVPRFIFAANYPFEK